MRLLLKFSAVIDAINEKIGVVCNWLVLLACIVSGGNAMVRYAYDESSNAWLEVQWYMFAVIVMFGAAYTLKRNEHVRVDLFYMTLGRRGQLWIDILGTIVFLLPTCAILAWLSWPFFMQSYNVLEHSSNAGGLLRWPIKLVLPVGFAAGRPAGPFRTDQARRLPQRHPGRKPRSALREADAMIIPLEWMPPLMFAGLVVFMIIGYPVAFSLAAVGFFFGFLSIEFGYFTMPFMQAIPGRVFGIILQQRAAARHPVLHLHGRHPGEMRAGRGHAGIDGPAVRPGARRARLLDHHRRLHPGRHHRHGGGAGHRHGADHAADHDALQVRHALRHRRAGGLGHHHPAGAAVAGADRAGRPARPLGRRHVSRRLGPLAAADRPVRRLHLLSSAS